MGQKLRTIVALGLVPWLVATIGCSGSENDEIAASAGSAPASGAGSGTGSAPSENGGREGGGTTGGSMAEGVSANEAGAAASGGSAVGGAGGAASAAGGGMGGAVASTEGGTQTGGTGSAAGAAAGGQAGAGSSGGGGGTQGGSAGAGSGGSAGAPPTAACPKPAGEICHEFFANENSRNQIIYVNEFDPSKSWKAPVNVNATGGNSPRQIELVANAKASGGQAIMVSVETGYQEYDRMTGARLVNVTGQNDVRGAARLANGDTVLGVGDSTLRVISASGSQVRTCTLPGSGADSLRLINRDPDTGNLLLGRALDLFIVNAQCQQQWNVKLASGGKATSVFPRLGGGVWASSGSLATLIAYDAQGQIVTQVGGKTAHPGLGLDFLSGFAILPNGNLLAANWLGHVPTPAQATPHLVEFSPDNKLVWRWGNQTLARQITNTLVLR